jgi:putative flippase GtrA
MYSALAIWEDMRTFVLYSATGVITTFIFWGVEFAFYFLFSFPLARYIGGMIGLIIGYFLKYNLDKKFVFIKYIFKK